VGDQQRPSWYTLAAILASSLATGTIALLVALHVNTESDRKWCSVVETMNAAYAAEPPTTPTGQELAARLVELRRKLECPAR
jgi:hypothetical protein